MLHATVAYESLCGLLSARPGRSTCMKACAVEQTMKPAAYRKNWARVPGLGGMVVMTVGAAATAYPLPPALRVKNGMPPGSRAVSCWVTVRADYGFWIHGQGQETVQHERNGSLPIHRRTQPVRRNTACSRLYNLTDSTTAKTTTNSNYSKTHDRPVTWARAWLAAEASHSPADASVVAARSPWVACWVRFG